MRQPNFVRVCTTGEEDAALALHQRLAMPADLHRVFLDLLPDPAATVGGLGRLAPRVLAAWRSDLPSDRDRGVAALSAAVQAGVRRIQVTPSFARAGLLDEVLRKPGRWARTAREWMNRPFNGWSLLDEAYGKTRPQVFVAESLPPGTTAWKALNPFGRVPSDGLVVAVAPESATDWEEVGRIEGIASDCRYRILEPTGPWAYVARCRPREIRADWIVLTLTDVRKLVESCRLRASPSLWPIPVATDDTATSVTLAKRLNAFFEKATLSLQAVPVGASEVVDASEVAWALGTPLVILGTKARKGPPPGTWQFPGEPPPMLLRMDPGVSDSSLWRVLHHVGIVSYPWPPTRKSREGQGYEGMQMAFHCVLQGGLWRWPHPVPRLMHRILDSLIACGVEGQSGSEVMTVKGPVPDGCDLIRQELLWAGDDALMVPYLAALGAIAPWETVVDGTDRVRSQDCSELVAVFDQLGFNVRMMGGFGPPLVPAQRVPSCVREEPGWDDIDMRAVADGHTIAAALLVAQALDGTREFRLDPARMVRGPVQSACMLLECQRTGRWEGESLIVTGKQSIRSARTCSRRGATR